MNSTIRYLLALPLLVFLSGCIVLPLPTGSGDDEPFAKKKLAFIDVGKSTKEDIASAMPRPMEFLGGDLWLYWEARNEATWNILAATIGDGGIVAETGEIDFRFLVIRFNENGVVAAIDTSGSEKRLGCNRSGVCGIGTTYMLVAPEEQARAVKEANIPEYRCGVYVYVEPRTLFHIRLERQIVGGLLGTQGFIFEQLDQGARQLRVASENNGFDQLVDFTCKSGDSVYFEVQKTKAGLFSRRLQVTQRDVSEGRRAIDKRKLMLREGT